MRRTAWRDDQSGGQTALIITWGEVPKGNAARYPGPSGDEVLLRHERGTGRRRATAELEKTKGSARAVISAREESRVLTPWGNMP